MSQKVKKSVTLDSNLVEKIEKTAKDENRNFSMMLNEIIRRYYEDKESAN